LIHCLPGQDKCGRNHSCYYSGLNYQCCPLLENKHIKSPSKVLECPTPMLTVVDEDENPIKCNPLSRSCPTETMVCMKIISDSICCEDILPNNKYHSESSNREELKIDCPQATFTMVDSDNKPIKCDDDACMKVVFIFVLYFYKAKIAELPVQSPQSSVEILNYSPHSSGGYAVSRSFAAKTEKVDNSKHLAREFLMEQIRNGWPYAERFYRTYEVQPQQHNIERLRH
uniref:WAP domain-containing protein n=1 Tax=Dracunculus medinensis TaxID=318479 RepID=A0A0N4U834_DRAME